MSDDPKQQLVETFQSVTQISDQDLARQFLEAASWNLEVAVSNALDNPNAPTKSPSSRESSDFAANGGSTGISNGNGSTATRRRARGTEPDARTVGSGSRERDNARNRNVTRTGNFSILSWPFGFVWGTTWSIITYTVSFVPCLERWLNRVVAIFHARYSGSSRPQIDPKQAVARFRTSFESSYGTRHPAFYDGSYSQALNDAKQNYRFLLVVLQSDEHDDTDSFNRQVLSSQELTDFVREKNILVWCGNVGEADAFQVSSTLSATAFPFMALIAYHHPRPMGMTSGPTTGPGRMSVVERIEGHFPVDQIIRILTAQHEKYNPPLVVLRAERAERETGRRIREMQDQAYEESLRLDREKERKAREEKDRMKEEEERKKKEEEDQVEWEEARFRHVRSLLAYLPPEAEATAKPQTPQETAHLSFKLLTGERIVRKFKTSEPIEHLYIFIETYGLSTQLENEDTKPTKVGFPETVTCSGKPYVHRYDFVLVAPFPRKEYADRQTTIGEAGGLWPSAGLIVEVAED